MNEQTKKIIEKIVIFFAPIFTIIMYSLPWMGLYKYASEGNVTIESEGTYYSCIDLLKSDLNVYTKIIIWISIIGVIATIVLYILSVILKDKEKLFTKIGAITLVASVAILFLTIFAKLDATNLPGGYVTYKWADFMTLEYGFVVVYSVACLIYIMHFQDKKESKKIDNASN